MNISDKITQISYFILRRILSPIIKFIWVKDIKGLENIPKKGPVILAFNHQSYFDFISFIAVSLSIRDRVLGCVEGNSQANALINSPCNTRASKDNFTS